MRAKKKSITLQEARENLGYTQKEVAKRIGSTESSVCRWENGIVYPNVKSFEKLCEVYRVSMDSIILP